MRNKIVPSANISIICLITITFVAILNVQLFSLYSRIALYVSALIALYGFLKIGSIVKRNILLVISSIGYTLCSVIFTGGGIGSVLTFFIALLVMEICAHACLTSQQERYVLGASLVILIYLFLYSFRYGSNWYYYQDIGINPNTVGFFILYAFSIIYCLSDNYIKSSRKRGIATLLFFLISLYAMFNLKSRGTLVALVVLFLLISIPKRILSGRFLFLLTIIIVGVGIAFPLILLYLYYNNFSIVFFGKSLYTGRELIWISMFSELNGLSDWLFGLGSKVELWANHNLNVHNDYFAIIVNFGIVGFSLFEIYMFSYIKKACKMAEKNDKCRKWLYMFISSVLVLGISETVTHWAVIFVFSYMSLGLAQNSMEEKQIDT